MTVGQILGGLLVTILGALKIMLISGVLVLVTTLLPLPAPDIASFGNRECRLDETVERDDESEHVATDPTLTA